MPTRQRKVRKQRGSRTHGWGTSGQHRKGGMRGGHGKAGWCKHKWTYTIKYDIDRIGKHGFLCPTSKGALKTINVGDLSQILLKTKSKDKPPAGEIPLINLKDLGYQKLLGTGKITQPFQLIIDECTAIARKKVEEAGGAIEATAKKEKQ